MEWKPYFKCFKFAHFEKKILKTPRNLNLHIRAEGVFKFSAGICLAYLKLYFLRIIY